MEYKDTLMKIMMDFALSLDFEHNKLGILTLVLKHVNWSVDMRLIPKKMEMINNQQKAAENNSNQQDDLSSSPKKQGTENGSGDIQEISPIKKQKTISADHNDQDPSTTNNQSLFAGGGDKFDLSNGEVSQIAEIVQKILLKCIEMS